MCVWPVRAPGVLVVRIPKSAVAMLVVEEVVACTKQIRNSVSVGREVYSRVSDRFTC